MWPGVFIFGMLGFGVAAPLPEQIRFNRDVRPILSNTCFKCHGADESTNEAGLRLDLEAVAHAPIIRADGSQFTPIQPGSPAESEVWKRIMATEASEVMPPPDNLHQLSDRDKAILTRWIEQGAAYEPHWAYMVPERVDPPVVSQPDWVSNPIDAFVLAKLDEHRVSPSPQADRHTLIRRLSLDLVGLPPSPEEVQAFVTDDRADAYERLVDRLLDSPHFGERMAVPWLDVVRFADTVGFHGDQGQNIFPYRDYVIEAFNANKPYDAFLTEQIAGDLLPDPTADQLVATGFNRLNMMTREGGAQAKEYLAKYNADRVRAVSTAFLGSTLACAECHDHKYDPFTTKDFYSLAAFFADVKQFGVYSDYDYTPEPELKGWNNNHPFPPEIEVKSDYLVQRLARLQSGWDQFISDHAARIADDPNEMERFSHWVDTLEGFLEEHPTGWEVQVPTSATSSRDRDYLSLKDGGLISISSEDIHDDMWRKDTLTFHLDPELRDIGTLKIEFVPDSANNGSITRNPAGYFEIDLQWKIQRDGQEEFETIDMAMGEASAPTRNYFNGWHAPYLWDRVHSAVSLQHDGFFYLFHPKRVLNLEPGDQIVVEIRSRDVGSMRLSVSPLGMISPATDPVDGLLDSLVEAFVETGIPLANDPNEQRFYYRKEILLCRDGWTPTMVTQATEPMEIRVLPRGDWQDDSGEVVLPETPAFMAKLRSSTEGNRQTRLDLAEWITHPENPLTSRTFVNRLWKQFFGTGLSSVTDDLGNQGEWPSHPELLDYLAIEFVERGWDIKAMIKLIVTSSTYRQTAKGRPELVDLDPDNRLLARQSARRLEAEFVRDNALAVSGLLVDDIGGPSVRPYQPPGHYEHLNFPIRRYESDPDEQQYRRGVYMHWQRTFLHPMLANFDAPGREECTADRTLSNTPQQALTLLNDPTFVEAARVFAQNSLLEYANLDVEDRVRALFFRTLGREPTVEEQETLTHFFAGRQAHYESDAAAALAFTSIGNSQAPEHLDPVELASWTAVTRVLLNLNETIVRY